MPSLKQVEQQITDLLRSRINGLRPNGMIKCEASEGSSGFTGRVTTGLFQRKETDVTELLQTPSRPSPDLFELLQSLREASRQDPCGPYYRVNIHLRPFGKINYEYFWENRPIASLAEVERDIDGHVPDFLFKRRFDRGIVEELSDFEINNCLLFYVPARLAENKPVSKSLMEVFATVEWQSDMNNGGPNQYFARDHEPMTGLLREELYAITYRGLKRIKQEAAAALFADSIALFAHFYPRVEQARIKMQIPQIPRQDESDIADRYTELERSLDDLRAAYVREHIHELEQ